MSKSFGSLAGSSSPAVGLNPVWMIKTSVPTAAGQYDSVDAAFEARAVYGPSSRTDSLIWTDVSPSENFLTLHPHSCIPRLRVAMGFKSALGTQKQGCASELTVLRPIRPAKGGCCLLVRNRSGNSAARSQRCSSRALRTTYQ